LELWNTSVQYGYPLSRRRTVFGAGTVIVCRSLCFVSPSILSVHRSVIMINLLRCCSCRIMRASLRSLRLSRAQFSWRCLLCPALDLFHCRKSKAELTFLRAWARTPSQELVRCLEVPVRHHSAQNNGRTDRSSVENSIHT